MVPHSSDVDIKGKVEIQKMRRLPRGYPFFGYNFGEATPDDYRQATFVPLIDFLTNRNYAVAQSGSSFHKNIQIIITHDSLSIPVHNQSKSISKAAQTINKHIKKKNIINLFSVNCTNKKKYHLNDQGIHQRP
ncbi:hypothetical protein AQ505_08880 [Pedobacter sp. PACM 27299]|nr:hypothetical protein AQ505_08880 [Pedobacter sp. PACM 27299]